MDSTQSNNLQEASEGCHDDKHHHQQRQDDGLDANEGYQIYFEDKVVPATLIQSGVLKAQCPGMLIDDIVTYE